MATLTEITQPGAGSAGGEVAEPHTRRATDRSAGPDLLVWAAEVLPAVVGHGPVRCADVHAACYEAACGRRMGRDRPHRLRLADEALDLFAAYLVSSDRTAPVGRGTDTVWAWLVRPGEWRYPSLTEVQLALAAAGGFWHRELSQVSGAGTAHRADRATLVR